MRRSTLVSGVQSPNYSGEKNVFETGRFGWQGPVAPPRGHKLEEVLSRMRGVRDDLFCSFD